MAGEPNPKGTPSNMPSKVSPHGSAAKPVGRQMLSQKPRRRSTRSSSGDPAMMAALIEPMEMPEIQLGRMPASCRPWYTPAWYEPNAPPPCSTSATVS